MPWPDEKKLGGEGEKKTQEVNVLTQGHSISQLKELKIEHIISDENHTLSWSNNEKNEAQPGQNQGS